MIRFYRCLCGHFDERDDSRCIACGARRERIRDRCGPTTVEDADGNVVVVPATEDAEQMELMP